MRSCLVVGRVFLISGQKIDVSRGCLSDRVAMLQMSNALKSTSEGRSPKVCRAMVLPSSCGVEASVSQEALQVVLSYWKISWQWCHSSNWLVSVDLGVLIRAVDVGVHDTSSESGRRTTDRPSWTPDALRLRSCLPTCVSPQPPAKFAPCPLPVLLCCPRTFLLSPRPAGASLNTCACLVCATPPYRRPNPYRTYIESIPERAHSTRPNIDAAHSGSPGGYSWTVKKTLFIWLPLSGTERHPPQPWWSRSGNALRLDDTILPGN